MHVTKQPASRGIYWLSEGLRILSRQPVALLALTFIMLMIMLLTMGIPGIGPIVSLALVPPLYVGLMHAIRACDRGEQPNPVMLFTAFTTPMRAILQQLIVLGLINAALTIVARLLASMLAPDPAMFDNTEEIGNAKVGVEVLWPMLLFGMFYAPVQMALWYAPLLIAWHEQPVGKAVFFSLVSFWRNKWPFAVLFIGWVAFASIGLIVLRTLGMALSLSGTMLTVIAWPIIFFGLAALQCSFWVTYRDVFTGSGSEAERV